MELFVAVVIDPHTDEKIRVFSTAEKAIAWADREFAAIIEPDDRHDAEPDGECIWGTYNGDGNYRAWVERRTLDAERGGPWISAGLWLPIVCPTSRASISCSPSRRIRNNP